MTVHRGLALILTVAAAGALVSAAAAPPGATDTVRLKAINAKVSAKGEIPSRHGDGAAGLSVAELSVRGIMQSRGSLVAMIEGPDKKTYIVHQGDRLLDGTIKNVTPQGLVVVQEVNDPLSLIKQREVRKLLRSLEDAKE